MIQRRSLARFSSWPVRWRIAFISAAATLLILVAFAVIVGQFLTKELNDNFNDEVQSAANEVAAAIRVRTDLTGAPHVVAPNLRQVAIANTAWVRLVSGNGYPYKRTGTAPAGTAAPQAGITTQGSVSIATAAVPPRAGLPNMFVQYARSNSHVTDTTNRIWVLLALGVLIGTALAAFAGMRVARRAMRPIQGLTSTAKEIALTGDPSQRIGDPGTSDEVAELAETFDGMLQALDGAQRDRESMITWQREFVADASHELRTPLTSAYANLEILDEMLEREGPAASEEREIVQSALRSSKRMKSLVNDLILLARADAERVSVRKECDLAEITKDAIREVKPIAPEYRIDFKATGPANVDGNPDELHRLVLNLIDNAVRHTPSGTEIEVRVEGRNGRAVVEVSDSGPGVEPGMRGRVFDRFVHGEGPADQSSGGVGLGLAIVRAVAESHGGSARVEQADGGGARFIVELPRAKTSQKTLPT